jgi:hypothetical protein
MGETRLLANRTLHSGLVRNAFSGADVSDDGKVRFPIPDPTRVPTYHWQVFTWEQNREPPPLLSACGRQSRGSLMNCSMLTKKQCRNACEQRRYLRCSEGKFVRSR